MKIVLTGGGSGGHITPLLAVAHKLRQLNPSVRLIYIGEYGGRLSDVARSHPDIDESYRIFAGKFRRYHGEGLGQLLDLKTVGLNIRDLFYVFIGFWQALWRLGRIRPSVIFIKGGFVGVPVGLAAAVLGIPFVTHDSDSMPGLANRLVSRWARFHCVALPAELYPYPAAKTVTVGVPIDSHFVPVTDELRRQYRQELGLSQAKQVVFVTGGGLGAERLNKAVTAVAGQLLREFPGLFLLHTTGRGLVEKVRTAYAELDQDLQKRIIVKDFVSDLYLYSGSADVIIARAGASALAEFAAQAQACVIVPNPVLTGGHQLKNAAYLEADGQVKVVSEEQLKTEPEVLLSAVSQLLTNHDERSELGRRLNKLANPHAAGTIASLLLDIVADSKVSGSGVV